MKKVLEILSEEIERYDRLVDSSWSPFDQALYNQVAHVLRNVKSKVKDSECQDTESETH